MTEPGSSTGRLPGASLWASPATERDSGPFEQRTLDSACADAVTLVTEYARHAPGRAAAGPGADRSRRVGALAVRSLARALRGAGADHRGRHQAAGAAGRGRKVARGRRGRRRGRRRRRLWRAQGPRPIRLALVGRRSDSQAGLRRARTSPSAHAQLGEDAGLFLRWIAIHETTHAVQFGSVPWLRPHLVGLLDRLLEGASARLDHTSLSALAKRLFRTDPRKTRPRRDAGRASAAARRARAGSDARRPPGGDVRDRGACRARDGRRSGVARRGLRAASCPEGDPAPAHRAEPKKPFRYFDKGSMATISRFWRSPASAKTRVTGFFAWLMWLAVHLVYLIGFKHRLTTLCTGP